MLPLKEFWKEEENPEDLGEALMCSWGFSHVKEFGLLEVGTEFKSSKIVTWVLF